MLCIRILILLEFWFLSQWKFLLNDENPLPEKQAVIRLGGSEANALNFWLVVRLPLAVSLFFALIYAQGQYRVFHILGALHPKSGQAQWVQGIEGKAKAKEELAMQPPLPPTNTWVYEKAHSVP